MSDSLLEDLEAQLIDSTKRLEGLTKNLPTPNFFTEKIYQQPERNTSGLRSVIGSFIFLGSIITGAYFLLSHEDKQYREKISSLNAAHQVNEIQSPRRIQTKPVPNVYLENKDISVDFGRGNIYTELINNLSINQCTLESRDDNSNHLKMGRGQSYSFDFSFLDKPASATIEVKHLSSSSRGKPGITPVTLYINQMKVKKWKQLKAGYTINTIPIESYLRSGKNSVSFTYDSDGGTTYYWQKYVRIKSK